MLEITTAQEDIPGKIKEAVEASVEALDGVEHCKVVVSVKSAPNPEKAAENSAPTPPSKLEGVKHIIAVASGKGGVGKSTFVSNLASAVAMLLKKKGLKGERVGIMDCDIFGPSIPLMMGANGRPSVSGEMIQPLGKSRR